MRHFRWKNVELRLRVINAKHFLKAGLLFLRFKKKYEKRRFAIGLHPSFIEKLFLKPQAIIEPSVFLSIATFFRVLPLKVFR